MIPKHVAMPIENGPDAGKYEHRIWVYVRNTLLHLGADVVFDPMLKRPCWSAFEIRVDGQVAVIDYSDFLLVHPASAGYRHWLRIQYVVGFLPFPNLGSFPQYSFLDWDEYYRLAAADPTPGERIMHVQYIRSADGPATGDKVARRNLARRLLLEHFGDAIDIETTRTLQEYFEKGMNSLASVHIPGNWRHCLDRGQQQLMGLGVCTISPEIWTVCLDQRPQPWQHYVPLRDDYSDLPERIRWCLGNRDECQAIGRRAKRFFQAHSTPEAIWTFVKRRLG